MSTTAAMRMLFLALVLLIDVASAGYTFSTWPGLFGCLVNTYKAKTGDNAKLPPSVVQKVAKADALLRGNKRTLTGAEKALKLYEEAHSEAPKDLNIRLKCADAANAYMRIKTHANTILIEGGLDTPENKKVWAKMGPKALAHATAAYKARPGQIEALAVYADSFMFSTSSKGIISQALKGAGNEFKRVAAELRKVDYHHDSSVGTALLGCFYAVAPWPVGDIAHAMRLMDEAAKAHPSRRNLYYVGVVAYRRGDWQKATKAFERALRSPCGSATEHDFGDFMLEKSREGLMKCKSKLVQAHKAK